MSFARPTEIVDEILSPAIWEEMKFNSLLSREIWIKMLTLHQAKRSDYLKIEKNNKQTYLAPSTLVFEVVQDGVICVSGERNGYGQAIEDEWI